jgi:hypothetical protein
MKQALTFTALLLLAPLTAADAPADSARAWAKSPVVTNKIKDACKPVRYAGQRLDPASYLGRRVDLNFRSGLLQTFSVEDYLASYGTNPKWPTGEYLGKIMQGLSRMHLYTGDATARERLDRIVARWREIQTDDGWLGTTTRFKSWDIWEHKYVLLGLVDYYALTGDEKVLNAASKIGDLYCATIGPDLGDISQSGHWALGSASILEPMTYLYRYTGAPKYLRFCEYLVASFESPTGPKLISTLTNGSKRVCDIEDTFAMRAAREVNFKGGGQVRNRSKGYEMLSCIIGLARMYQLTGQPEYLAVAVNAWDDIARNRLYLAGSSGADECFKDDHCLPAETSDGPAEGCVTAHWVFLSRVLFEITGEPRYADAIETALYNYLLASQRPQDCFQSYNTGMNGTKTFQRHDVKGAVGKAPCCLTSVMREIARTPEAVWAKFGTGGLGVLLYAAGSMEDTIQTKSGLLPVRVEMNTDFPKSGNVTLRVRPQRPAAFRLALRVPGWAKDFNAQIAGQKHAGTPGQFLKVEREWKDGDVVAISMDLNERLVPGGASYPAHFAFMRGPQVLTLVAGKGAEHKLAAARVRAAVAPTLAGAGDFLPSGWIGGLAYTSPALVAAEGCALIPFGDSSQAGVSRECRTWIPLQPEAGMAVPAAPSELKATALSGTRIQLSWSGDGRNADGWRIERRRTDVGLWFHVKTIPPRATSCVDDFTNVVMPGKTYTYRVAAFSAGGESEFSNEATVTTPAVAVPAAPSELKAIAVSPTLIKLTWKDNSDSEDGFQLECRVGAAGEWKPVQGRTPANVPSFTDYGLDSGQTYAYRVRVFNAAGESAWSNEVAARTNQGNDAP